MSEPVKCPICDGKGKLPIFDPCGVPATSVPDTEVCPACHGACVLWPPSNIEWQPPGPWWPRYEKWVPIYEPHSDDSSMPPKGEVFGSHRSLNSEGQLPGPWWPRYRRMGRDPTIAGVHVDVSA